MLRAWKSRATCRTPAEPWSWLARIVRNEAFREHGRRREQVMETIELGTTDDVGDRVDALAAREAMARLAPRDRLLPGLRYDDDLSHPEIARLTGSPVGTVKVQLHRARRRLRDALER
jgi:RNA polymerase sigma-70 factor (ECF subfamily)